MVIQKLRRFVLGLMLMLVGCSLFSSEPEKLMVESEYDRAFDKARSVISTRFSIQSANRETGQIKSRWKVYPSDVLSKRKRLLATVKQPEEAPENVIRVTLRSEVQTVESAMNNYRTEQAAWDDAGRDRKLEQDLLKLLRYQLTSEQMERDILQQVERSNEREKRLEELKTEEQSSE